MVKLSELESYCNDALDTASFDDYCPNGLQVDAGGDQIERIVSGVTASQALIDAAVERKADLLLVHHGFFWKGEAPQLTGIKGRRGGALYSGQISLLAYHLPLDAHLEWGNNRQLAERLGFPDPAPAPVGNGLLWTAELAQEESAQQIEERIASALGRRPLCLPGGDGGVRRVGWCSGGAQEYIHQAAALGLDAFISGEVSEQTTHLARELGVHYFAAGHHATERFGVQALGEHLAQRFGLEHLFVDISNPV